MIKHIVCWKLKDAENNEINLHEIKKKLLNLKELISEIKNIEVGINSKQASVQNFDIVLISEFENFNDLSIYQEHPAHKEAGSFIRKVTKDRAAIDFKY